MTVPLDQPHYGIGPAGMVRWLRKYATFRGRASRSELWWGALAHSIVVGVLALPGTVLTLLALARANAAAAEAFTVADGDSSTRPAAPFAGIAAWIESLLGASEVAIAVGIGAAASLLVLVPLLTLWWRRLQDAGAPRRARVRRAARLVVRRRRRARRARRPSLVARRAALRRLAPPRAAAGAEHGSGTDAHARLRLRRSARSPARAS